MADVYGVPMFDLEELGEGGFTPFEAVVILKGFNGEGDMSLIVVVSEGIPSWELLGMAETLKQDAVMGGRLVAGGGEDDEYEF